MGKLRYGIVALIALAVSALAVSSAPASGFCEEGIARNYLAPLEKLPPIRTLSWPDTNLPFGPDGLSLIESSEVQRFRPLIVPGAAFGPRIRPLGFKLVNEPSAGSHRLQLNWQMTARLLRFVGGRERILGAKSMHIVALNTGARRQLLFPVPSSPGSYLVEIEFRDAADRRLGRLGNYLRVVPLKQEARISLSSTELKPGETLNACLENLGTQTLLYGEGKTIEVFDGSTWGGTAIDPPGAISAIGLYIEGGEETNLPSFTVPADAPPGLYRYSWSTSRSATNELTLSPEFRIGPAA